MSKIPSATGHCLCGAVKFSATDVDTEMHVCHCGMCRRHAGAPTMSVHVGDIAFEGEGDILRYKSSDFAERGTCKKCGGHLFYHLFQPDMYIMSIGAFDDQSKFITRAITSVTEHAYLGAILVVAIIFAFLRNVRSTLIICTSIPISVIGTFALLYFGGFTLNTMTFGGLALGVGMIVDASIVVLENAFRHMEHHGKDRVTAAIEGSEEVWSAILASILTHIAVFVPLLFLTGVSSVMFRQLSVVVVFSLGMSLFVAITLVPVLCAKLLVLPKPASERTGFTGRLVLGQPAMRWAEVEAYVHALRELLAGRIVEWDGAPIQMIHPDGFSAPTPLSIPILVSAMGPKGIEIASRIGDGVMSVSAPQAGFDWSAVLIYGTVLDEFRQLVIGAHGTPPAPIEPGIRRAVELLGADVPSLDDDPPSADDVREAAEGLASSEEDLVLLAMYGNEAETLLRSIRQRHSREASLLVGDVDVERGERIRELVRIVQESGVGEIEIEDEGMRVSVRRADEPGLPLGVPADVALAQGPLDAAVDVDAATIRVESPMVGVFYRAPNPGAPPFVDVGDTIVPGQTLCLLEAMKLFNELKAEVAGTVRSIHADNAQPVEYGQLLFVIEPVLAPPAV